MGKYNYVLFNTYDNRHYVNKDGYYYICTTDLLNSSNIRVVTIPLENSSSFIRLLFDIHNSQKIEKYIKLPFKSIWYPYYFKDDFNNNKPICFIILNHFLPVGYLKYLKNKYPNCRIVLLHRDLIKVSKGMNPQLTQNPYLDLEMSFDKGEALKNGFPHFDEFESKIEVPVESKMESDVFFAGYSKGRLPFLLEAYDIFTKAGLDCKFYITGVPKNERITLPGIEYADKQMTYKEMLYQSVNTRCLLEVNQANCDGYTSRFLEAIIYGKKLITNNPAIFNTKYYSPEKIQIVKRASDINPLFVRKGSDFVDYNYQEDFSPLKMIGRVEEELIKRFGDE